MSFLVVFVGFNILGFTLGFLNGVLVKRLIK